MDAVKAFFEAAFGPGVISAGLIALVAVGSKVFKPQIVGADAQAKLIQDLQDERDTHKTKAEVLQEQNNLLREELAAIKIYLRVKFGVTDADFKAEMRGNEP